MEDLKINSTKDLKKEGKSFFWASFFLPKNSKIEAGNLYSICRYFDNKADEDKKDKTEFLLDSIKKIKENKNNHVYIFLSKNEINHEIFFDLITGLIKDQNQTKIKDLDELIQYSYYVAGTVGIMMSKIIGVKKKEAIPSAIDLGIAMQMTNIARDVYEDAQMHRIYLPSSWISNIDLDILSGKKKPNLEQNECISKATHKLIDLADKFYINGFSGLKYIPFKTRLAIFIAANVYRGIGIKIKSKGNYYVKERVHLNTFEKILITIKSIIFFFFIPILNYKYLKIRKTLPNEDI